MDLDAQVDILAGRIINELHDRVRRQVLELVQQKMVSQVMTELKETIQKEALEIVQKQIVDHVSAVDMGALFNACFAVALGNNTFRFPDKSVPAAAIDTSNFIITGDHVNGGIIQNFGSTGIDDKATNCQVSIFDEVTVVENNLLTKDLTVKGTVNIEGTLNVSGNVPETSPMFISIVNASANNVMSKLDTAFLDTYSTAVFDKIKTEGLDLSSLTFNGLKIIDNNTLSNNIRYSNLQKVGQLKELQVSGETLLSETLYTTSKRVGINTIEPSNALSVWDQEVEIGIGKKEQDTAILGTPRAQTLIISSNNKRNLTITPDGQVQVDSLTLSGITISASSAPPSNDRPKGTIVFNSNPNLGGPIGWISLGGAKWANFGIID